MRCYHDIVGRQQSDARHTAGQWRHNRPGWVDWRHRSPW